MLSTFGDISKNFSLKPKFRTIDNAIFKLHYRLTFLLLVVSTVLVCSRQYVGEHIRCVSDIAGSVAPGVIETYCFFSSTFTVARHLDGVDGVSRLHPGVGPHTGDEEVRYHAYYQWVPFVLFGQAIMFYLPHLLWRKLDGGLLFKMSRVLHNCTLAADDHAIDVNDVHIFTKNERQERVNEVRHAFVSRLPFLNTWAKYLVLCEILNLLNVVGQIFLTDLFLAGKFLTLGPKLVSKDDTSDGSSILDQVFPKMTKCDFRKYGPSGTIQNHDALCVMALNIINEKIYSVLWFWFMILAGATVLGLLWRMITVLLHRRSKKFNLFLFRSNCPGPIDEKTLDVVTGSLSFSQWLFLYYLGKNMDGFIFQRLLTSVANQIYDDREGLLNAHDDGDLDEEPSTI